MFFPHQVAIEPADELNMTFLTEHDFLDWVVVQEYTEKKAYRMCPRDILLQQIHSAQELPGVFFESATEILEDTAFDETDEIMIDLQTTSSGFVESSENLISMRKNELFSEQSLETIHETQDESDEQTDSFTFKRIPEIPIENFIRKGFVDLEEERKKKIEAHKLKLMSDSNRDDRRKNRKKQTLKALMSIIVFLGAVVQGYVLLMKYV